MATEKLTLEEDPATFLARVKEECPELPSVLSKKILELVQRPPNEPYSQGKVDEEYLSDAGAQQLVRSMWRETRNNLNKYLLEPKGSAKALNPQDLEAFEKKNGALEKVMNRAQLLVESRLKATEEKLGECYLPRIIRLCKQFKFSENETRLAIFTLISQGGLDDEPKRVYDPYAGSSSLNCISACQFLDIPVVEIIAFLSKERLHMEQGLFPDIQESYILSSQISYDGDFCRALMGAKLTSNEFLKLEQTQLAGVILEEPGSEYLKMKSDEKSAGEVPTGDATQPPGIPKEEAESGEKPKEGKDQEELDLDTIIRLEREKEQAKDATEEEPTEDAPEDDGTEDKTLKPYKKDLEYLDDHFQLIQYKLKVRSVDSRMEEEAQYDYDNFRPQTTRYQRIKREALTKEKVQEKMCEKRMALTRAAGPWVPRLERMIESRNLCNFEKNVLLTLIGAVLQPTKFNIEGNFGGKRSCHVGDLLQLMCTSLEDQIQHRKYFYKSATLVREGMIVVHNSGISGDPSGATVEVDRRMLDFCVGLDTEFSEVVEGSHLYFPKTKFEHVILPKEQKDLILNTVSNFDGYKRCRKRMGLDDAITYGAGMVMLFHGPPGTGKTMMANALANKLGKKVLLINFPSLGTMKADDNFKFIFRESKINDAILFFDECEAIFESREKGAHQVNLLLTEIERHDGMIVMATNRPYDLDEAMHRRIMIAIEFRQPDHILRKTIWDSHMPEQMKLADDIDIENLALRFELTGGFIKNAILSALSIAVSRDGDNPVVSQKDLLQGASLQLRGRLRMKDFDRRVVPAAGLDEVVVEESIMKQLKQIVQFEKARSILFGQWGFAKRNHKGLTVLLHGSPGTGKTLVAEAIGYEVGKALKVVNCGELLSKWVGESTKNIDAIFQEAQHQDAILVFDEAEGLFGQRTSTTSSTDRYANIDVGVLLYHIERFPGIVILTTNLIENLDMAFFRRLRFILHLEIPRQVLRAKLWKLTIPSETPLADDVDFERLSRHQICGGSIKNAIFRAAAEAALRSEGKRVVTMDDLEEACKDEIGKAAKRFGFRRQDSDAAGIYN